MGQLDYARRRWRQLQPHLSLALLLSCTLPVGVHAEGLDAKWLPKHTNAVVHIDVERAMKSPVLKSAAVKLLADVDLEKVKQELPENLKFLLKSDLRSVTALTTNVDDNPILRVHLKSDTKALINALEAAPEFAKVRHGTHRIYSWVTSESDFDRWFAKHFMDKFKRAPKKKKKDPVPFFLTEVSPNRYVIASNLRSILDLIDIETGTAKPMSAEELETIIGSVPNAVAAGYNLQHLQQLQRGEKPAGEPFLPISLIYDAEEQMSLKIKAHLDSESLAKQIEGMFQNTDLLAMMLKQIGEAAKHPAAKVKAAKRTVKDGKEAVETTNSLSVALSFSSTELDELKTYAKTHFQILRKGSTLDISWHGLLDFTYEFKMEDGGTHIALRGNLDLETPERTAKGKAKTKAR